MSQNMYSLQGGYLLWHNNKYLFRVRVELVDLVNQTLVYALSPILSSAHTAPCTEHWIAWLLTQSLKSHLYSLLPHYQHSLLRMVEGSITPRSVLRAYVPTCLRAYARVGWSERAFCLRHVPVQSCIGWRMHRMTYRMHACLYLFSIHYCFLFIWTPFFIVLLSDSIDSNQQLNM
jgi:hypothetical protein